VHLNHPPSTQRRGLHLSNSVHRASMADLNHHMVDQAAPRPNSTAGQAHNMGCPLRVTVHLYHKGMAPQEDIPLKASIHHTEDPHHNSIANRVILSSHRMVMEDTRRRDNTRHMVDHHHHSNRDRGCVHREGSQGHIPGRHHQLSITREISILLAINHASKIIEIVSWT